MEKTDNMPIWVYLAYSAINTRKGALILVWACVIFTLYCLPWSSFFAGNKWIVKLLKGVSNFNSKATANFYLSEFR